jgi:hypothetical protein
VKRAAELHRSQLQAQLARIASGIILQPSSITVPYEHSKTVEWFVLFAPHPHILYRLNGLFSSPASITVPHSHTKTVEWFVLSCFLRVLQYYSTCTHTVHYEHIRL